ncbi:hypothetical protein [Streptomyces inhibens]|uniref:hypothetical protein n=1 Tax=Streptomyces inhibens TaxID=2293571 RepID=UPI000FFC0807|nr:hypothetical protein [Streptomyces inhibens]
MATLLGRGHVRAAHGQDLDPSGASHGKPFMKVTSPLTWELVIDCEAIVNGTEWQAEASSRFMTKP